MFRSCRNPGLNRGPLDLQSNALPTELFRLTIDDLKRVFMTIYSYILNRQAKSSDIHKSEMFNLSGQGVHVSRLAQSVEHETLNLGVVGSSPTLGELFYNFSVKKSL